MSKNFRGIYRAGALAAALFPLYFGIGHSKAEQRGDTAAAYIERPVYETTTTTPPYKNATLVGKLGVPQTQGRFLSFTVMMDDTLYRLVSYEGDSSQVTRAAALIEQIGVTGDVAFVGCSFNPDSIMAGGEYYFRLRTVRVKKQRWVFP